MRFVQPPADVVPFGMRALKMVATVDHPLSPAARNVLAGAQRVLLRRHVPLDGLAPIAPDELAAHVADPALRRQLVQGMLMLSLADGPPSAAQMALVDAFAGALGVASPELSTMRLLAHEHHVLFKLDFFRHSHLARIVRDTVEHEGVLETARQILGQRGLHEDPALAARYQALERLPEGTLGRVFADHIRGNGFAFPGEKRGFPEGGIYHDLGHVLAGYDTSPEGEIQMTAFQAGYMKEQPFFMLLFGVLTFSAGINVTPLPQPEEGGIFAREGMVERTFHALERGAGMNVDLSAGWDHWAYVERPIDEVRAAIHLA
jgi:hypothetical protein